MKKDMKKFSILFIMLFIFVFTFSCSKVENPHSPSIVLPTAKIDINIQNLEFDYDVDFEVYGFKFDIILTESVGVSVTISELKIQTFFESVFLDQVIYTNVGTVPAKGTLTIPTILITDEEIDSFLISITGKDSNGHTITSSKTFS